MSQVLHCHIWNLAMYKSLMSCIRSCHFM
uniref:Predicted protein n=1 Tax=Hordeum vulgare subsp. vulgare TaxID=112509 RepID=F2EC19_HORVV|nr:predicted protein [Hordeum vulgare subsp. vulgare]